MSRRMKISLTLGVLLGVVCIIGASIRWGGEASVGFLFALWYNRVIIGLLIGANWKKVALSKSLLRGGFLGLLVSFGFYSAIGFGDPVSFLAGIVYGVIIELVIYKFGDGKPLAA